MLNRAAIQAMSEAELRERVLVPLFQSMGFRDVSIYHGGPLEQGKDIVMWRPDVLRGRTNLAVVIKATPISGQASGKSSAAEVTFQVRQCFGEPFQDPTTLERQAVDRCLIVSSHTIKKEARVSIASALRGSVGERSVDFIDGSKLLKLARKYLPAAALQGLEDARELFNSVSKSHGIIALVTPDGVTLSTVPKHAGAYVDEPVTFEAKFSFPSTEEGLAAFAALENHFATGAPVRVAAPFIAEFRVPEFLKPFITPGGQPPAVVEIGANRSTRPLWASLAFEGPSGRSFSLPDLEFDAIQVGREEITLSNERQAVPWHFRMRVRREARALDLTIVADYTEATVWQELLGARFQSALADGGRLSLVSRETGLPILVGEFPPGMGVAPSTALLEFLEDAMVIQRHVRAPVHLPKRPLTPDEVALVRMYAARLRSGRITTTTTGVCFRLDREGATRAAEEFAGVPTLPVKLLRREELSIFGQELPLGEVLYVATDLTLQPRDRDALLRVLAEAPYADDYEIRLAAASGEATLEIAYLDALPVAEAAELRLRLKG